MLTNFFFCICALLFCFSHSFAVPAAAPDAAHNAQVAPAAAAAPFAPALAFIPAAAPDAALPHSAQVAPAAAAAKRKCAICNEFGHRADNKRFHPNSHNL